MRIHQDELVAVTVSHHYKVSASVKAKLLSFFMKLSMYLAQAMEERKT